MEYIFLAGVVVSIVSAALATVAYLVIDSQVKEYMSFMTPTKPTSGRPVLIVSPVSNLLQNAFRLSTTMAVLGLVTAAYAATQMLGFL